MVTRTHAERQERTDVHGEHESGAQRIGIIRVVPGDVVSRQPVAVHVACEDRAEGAVIGREPAHTVDHQLGVGNATEIAARAEVEGPAADRRDVRVHVDGSGRRNNNRRNNGTSRSVEHRVTLRFIEKAERLQIGLVVEDLHLPAADQLRHAEPVGRAYLEQMHAILHPRRIDVGDEAAEKRGRKVRERIRYVRPCVAVDRRLHDAAVDVDIHTRDAVGVNRPSLDGERSGGVVHGGEVWDVEVTERRLIDRVVDADRTAAQLIHASIAEVDLDHDRVVPVGEAAGQEAGHETGRDVLDTRIVGVGLDDVDSRQTVVDDLLELIVNVQLDLRHLTRIEHPSACGDHSGPGHSRIRLIECCDEVLRVNRRREGNRQNGENQAAGNPSPHNPTPPTR